MPTNKYILADMATEKLERELGMVAKPTPEKIRVLETVLPSGRVRLESTLYHAEKLKKITISKRSLGKSVAGTLVMLIADAEYDLPFTLADIAFDFAEKSKISAAFQLRLLVNDEESMKKYVDPFTNWHEAILKLPSEESPLVAEPGEFMKANPPPLRYMRSLPYDCTDQVLKYTEQFFDIFLGIYRKAEPVRDKEQRKKMDSFRSEFNNHVLGDDPSGQVLTRIFGQEKARLFYEHFTYL